MKIRFSMLLIGTLPQKAVARSIFDETIHNSVRSLLQDWWGGYQQKKCHSKIQPCEIHINAEMQGPATLAVFFFFSLI